MKFTIPFLLFCHMSAAVATAAEATYVTISGTAYPANTITGASAVTTTGPIVFGGLGDAPSSAWSGKVVLLDRGTLSFAAKIKAVQDAGGVAAVVADNVAGALPTFTLAPSISTIPAVAVTQATGVTLKAKVGEPARVGSAEPVPPSVAFPDPKTSKGLWLMSDGTRWIGAPLPELWPVTSISSEVEIGKRLSFSVTSVGTPPFSYQWMKDGVNIPGATAGTYVITSAKAEDAGSYSCNVSNGKGSAPSGAHNVSVKAAL